MKINRAGPRPEYQGTEERQVRTIGFLGCVLRCQGT